jgi:hypothetical protein
VRDFVSHAFDRWAHEIGGCDLPESLSLVSLGRKPRGAPFVKRFAQQNKGKLASGAIVGVGAIVLVLLPPTQDQTKQDEAARRAICRITTDGVSDSYGVNTQNWGVVWMANHCQPDESTRVFFDGNEFSDVEIISRPKTFEGVVVLRVGTPEVLPYIEVRKDLARVGEKCYMLALPDEPIVRHYGVILSNTMSDEDGTRLLKTDHVSQPGDSGRPLLDADGRLIGLLSGGQSTGESIWVPTAEYRNCEWQPGELRQTISTHESSLAGKLK